MTARSPGRATHLLLRRRRAIARRGIDILEQKALALAREQRRLRHHVAETRLAWEDASRDADRWFLRAAVIGAEQQFELIRSLVGAATRTDVRWRSTMGVAYPAQTRLDLAGTAGIASLGRSSALVPAASAYRRAVTAALDNAAANRALHLVDEELAITQRRLRALAHRWLPQLERSLHEVELSLAEQEREDMVRARWVSGRRSSGTGRP